MVRTKKSRQSSAPPGALIVGATGATGRALVDCLLETGQFDPVHVFVRRAFGRAHPRLREWVAPILDFDSLTLNGPIEALFCTLGTTIRRAGSREVFYAVDHDLVIAAGRWAKAQGVAQFHVVTALGANPRSFVFYNRVKGEVERDLQALGLPSLTIYRPSLLHAPQREDRRFGEALGVAALSGLRLLPLRAAQRLRVVSVEALARTMARRAEDPQAGVTIVQSESLHEGR